METNNAEDWALDATVVARMHGFDEQGKDAFPFVFLGIVSFSFIVLIRHYKVEMLLNIWMVKCPIFAIFFQKLMLISNGDILIHVWMVWFRLHIILDSITLCYEI